MERLPWTSNENRVGFNMGITSFLYDLYGLPWTSNENKGRYNMDMTPFLYDLYG
jgi:hypothetical protein